MTDAATITSKGHGRLRRVWRVYFSLLKPRVMSLVVFTAATGLLVAPGQMAPLQAVLSIILIALGGGASGALNMWWDADIDAVMRRTRNRPIPAGRIAPAAVFWFGLSLALFSVLALGLVANPLAAGLLAFTIFFYVVIYSIWLKRRTPQNIVIGGLAGALPPMIGWAAATGDVSWQSLFMVALIFMWTPPHFWSLALFMRDDYSRAGVPMLTVTHGHRTTRRQILVYAWLLAVIAFTPIVLGWSGPVYVVVALWLNIRFVLGARKILDRDEAMSLRDGFAFERKYFQQSLVYLFLHFLAILADAGLQSLGVLT